MTAPVTHDPSLPRRARNRYCGPAAVAALTGETAERVATIIEAERHRTEFGRHRRPAQRTIPAAELLHALAELGRAGNEWVDAPATVGALPAAGRFLVLVRGHWLAVVDGVLFDNRNEAGVTVDAGDGRPVRRLWRVA